MRFLGSLLLIASLSTASAEEAAQTTFTYASGVKLLEQVAVAPNGSQSVSVHKARNGYEAVVTVFMRCQGELTPPWLTLGPKATLVLGKQSSTGGFNTKEDCGYRLKVSIEKDRLERGNTLYVVNEQVVVGHANVP